MLLPLKASSGPRTEWVPTNNQMDEDKGLVSSFNLYFYGKRLKI